VLFPLAHDLLVKAVSSMSNSKVISPWSMWRVV